MGEEESTERKEGKRVWKRRGMVLLTATLWSALWVGFLSLGSILFVYLEAENSQAVKADTRRNIEERLDEIWQLGLEAGLEGRHLPLPNDTQIIQTLIHDLAPDIGLEDLYEWDFTGGFHFCLTVVSTIGFGYLTPQTQMGQLMCICYGIVGIILNFKVMRIFGAIANDITYVFYRCLVAMTPKFIRVSWFCPVERARVVAAMNLMKNQQTVANTSAPDVPTGYRSDIYGNQSAIFDTEGVSRTETAWTITGSTRDQSHYYGHNQNVESLHAIPQSSSRASEGTEMDDPSLQSGAAVASRDAKHETLENCNNSHPPAWFVIFMTFLWLVLSSILLHESPTWEESGWSYITCAYFVFVMMSTIGFGDLGVGNLAPGRGGMVTETVMTVGGMLALTCLLECVMSFCVERDKILKNRCIMCCRKRERKR